MLLRLIYAILFGCLFVNQAAYAGYNSYFCAKTFKSISVGATMNAVRTACGAPTTTSSRLLQISTPLNTTNWIYTLGLVSIKGVTLNLPSLTVTFRDHKVIQIEKNSSVFTSGGYCSINGVIELGELDTTVLATCGRPNVVNNVQQMQNSTKQIIDWNYNFGPYKPQIIFSFDNGVLTNISSGQLGQ